MLTITQIAGFAGAALAGAAYVPQIAHLVRARCSAGLSRPAFAVWLLAALLTTTQAVAIGAGVFIALGGIQAAATALILACAARYHDTPCPSHLPRQPAAKPATGTGTPGNRPGPWPPPARPVAASAAPAGHGGAPRAARPRPGPAIPCGR
jgi:PQ loop repeat